MKNTSRFNCSAKPSRPGFERGKSVDALGWVDKIVECRETGGWFDERGHFVKITKARDLPLAGAEDWNWRGEWGWFECVSDEYPGETYKLHVAEIYPPVGQNV